MNEEPIKELNTEHCFIYCISTKECPDIPLITDWRITDEA